MLDEWLIRRKKRWENKRRKGRRKNICRGRQRKKERIIWTEQWPWGWLQCQGFLAVSFLTQGFEGPGEYYHEGDQNNKYTGSKTFLEESRCHHLNPLSAWILMSLCGTIRCCITSWHKATGGTHEVLVQKVEPKSDQVSRANNSKLKDKRSQMASQGNKNTETECGTLYRTLIQYLQASLHGGIGGVGMGWLSLN